MSHKRTHSWSNPASIGSSLAAAFNSANRFRFGSYVYGDQTEMARYGARKRRRIGSRTRTTRRRRGLVFKRGGIKRRLKRVWTFMRRKGLRNIETKYNQIRITTSQGGAVPPTPNTLVGTLSEITAGSPPVNINNCNPKLWITGINRGTGRDQRIGDKVFIKDVKLRGMIQANVDPDAANEVYFKIMVVRVKDAEAFDAVSRTSTKTPTIKQIYDFFGDTNDMDDPVSFGGREAFINTWKFYSNKWADDFTILKQKVIKIAKETGSPDEKKLFKMNIRVNQPAKWEDDSPQDGHIFIYYFCDSLRQNGASIGAELVRPVLRLTVRTTWTDI